MKMKKNVPLWKVLLEHKKDEEYKNVVKLITITKLKRVDKRLQVIKLHLEGKKQQEIADKLDYSREWVNKLLKLYREKGLVEYARHKYGGNHRSMSIEEEVEILRKFEKETEAGTLVVVKRIKEAFDKKRGKDTTKSYVYKVLERHKARKIMPRTSHPQKSSAEEIEASKKLTSDTGNSL
jgi:transposase